MLSMPAGCSTSNGVVYMCKCIILAAASAAWAQKETCFLPGDMTSSLLRESTQKQLLQPCPGARLTAYELMHDGLPATLICDSAAAALMAQGQVDAVVVGADRVAANGDTANKIGTYSLAVLAKHHK